MFPISSPYNKFLRPQISVNVSLFFVLCFFFFAFAILLLLWGRSMSLMSALFVPPRPRPCATTSNVSPFDHRVVGGQGGGCARGGAVKAERVCLLVLPGVRTCSPFEEAILHLWIAGLGAHPLGQKSRG